MQKLFLAVLFFFLIIPVSHSLDLEKGNEIELTSPELTYICITTIGEAEGFFYNHDKPGTEIKKAGYILRGSGVVLKHGYILTAAHVVNPSLVRLKKSDIFIHHTKAIKCLSKTIYISESPELGEVDGALVAEIAYIDQVLDIALLKYDHESYSYLIPTEYKIIPTVLPTRMGMMDLISISAPIFIVTYNREEDNERIPGDMEVRYGKIIDTEPLSRLKNVQKAIHSESFTNDLAVEYGDSGMPLMAWLGGEVVITGVVHSLEYMDAWSYAARTDSIYSYLDAVWPEEIVEEEIVDEFEWAEGL